MKIMFVGQGRAGKDTACEYFAKITGLKNAGTTSKYLCKYVAHELGVSEEEAFANRHANRQRWFEIGNQLREGDSTKLIRAALKNGDITGGVRDRAEILGAKEQNIVDLIVWVENNRVPKDPTVTFTSNDCDIVVENNGTLEEFYQKLARLAKALKLIKTLNPPSSESKPTDLMLKFKGETVRCNCGCNVFRFVSKDENGYKKYSCNSCSHIIEGK